MKSSTLHRSNLTKERMSMLENIKFQAKRRPLNLSQSEDMAGYVRVNKTPELDVLYRSLGKTFSKDAVSSIKSKAKNPGVYLGIGFFGGAVFLLIVSLVVWISSIPSKKVDGSNLPAANGSLEVVSETKEAQSVNRQEKYVIKSGDTLDKIAYRFYGKYDVKKIEEIKKINNITNPEGLQIGQVLIIPIDK